MTPSTKRRGAAVLLAFLLFASCSLLKSSKPVRVEIFHTTDLHGNLFPYDFIHDKEGRGSYSRVAAYLQEQGIPRSQRLLLDAGDILQGQPSAYYYNFIETSIPHLFARALNRMEYDAITVGNHDIETGHAVYDRWVGELSAPVLGANVIDVKQSETKGSNVPYFRPYSILSKGGKRFAILGLTTPAVPNFLPEVLWSGMRFDDIVETARGYIQELKEARPDYIIALVHCGIGSKADSVPHLAEDAGYALAREIPELNLVLLGHDHRTYLDSVQHPSGHTTYLLNPGNNGERLSHTTVEFTRDGVSTRPSIVELNDYTPDPGLTAAFASDLAAVQEFVGRPIGATTATLDARSVFLHPAPFADLIHSVQLSLFPEAQISITAPLALDTEIPAGPISMRDLFKLYRYENTAYLMHLTGQEIQSALEEVADRWIRTMTSPKSQLLRITQRKEGGRWSFELPFFNLDTAAGIKYTINVRKGKGSRVTITQLSDGSPFDLTATYSVVVNSYRGNGGGEILTQGAGIPHAELPSRVQKATDKDLRYYLMQYLQEHTPYQPTVISDWRFIPEEWAQPALQRDSLTLFTR